MPRLTLLLKSAYRWEGVAYVSKLPHPLQCLDIATPRQIKLNSKLPTCVFVHGGSWQRGDKSGGLNHNIDQAFVRAGCVGVSINYRLSPEVQHPEHAKDVAAAVAWLHRNIAKFGGDPDKLVLVGHSSGAHLIMQFLADPQFLTAAGLEKPIHTLVKGAVGISGVYNIVRLANTSFYGALATNPPFGDRVEQLREASIGRIITRVGAVSPLARMQLLLMNAEEDFHFHEDTEELKQWLDAAGNTSVQRHVIHNCNHFNIIQHLASANLNSNTIMRLIMDFVARITTP
ncbi:para-nitrobenzyl esterase [Plasmopara halstedii]|uniref:Kynurenine formamidase n=1 Tax=Plasmopara halstedii TaxID=4781 RepID=A0A0P1A615_PLAHL|nr:para-nitrobenzyl esterase [Plasmopara halstedii]CEG35628.1 para-nitrobenzyl esterase [Plasmopara halstedii]|eukprot:XP_024571997.1 para-nitrobenzyl esterase [Plasmopara halstedii]